MAAERKASLYWILLLLAALFLGPVLFWNTSRSNPPETKPLRTLAVERQLLDAPADAPASKSAAP